MFPEGDRETDSGAAPTEPAPAQGASAGTVALAGPPSMAPPTAVANTHAAMRPAAEPRRARTRGIQTPAPSATSALNSADPRPSDASSRTMSSRQRASHRLVAWFPQIVEASRCEFLTEPTSTGQRSAPGSGRNWIRHRGPPPGRVRRVIVGGKTLISPRTQPRCCYAGRAIRRGLSFAPDQTSAEASYTQVVSAAASDSTHDAGAWFMIAA